MPTTPCGARRTFRNSTFVCISDPHPDHPDNHYMRSTALPDREHVVQLSRADAIKLAVFSQKPNGSIRMGDRLTVEAVEGQGLLVRTKPYRSKEPS